MTVLHLGVIAQPYRTPPAQSGKGKTGKPGRKRRAQVQARTTVDVARILESKYHNMEVFYEAHASEINQMLVNAYAGAVETAMMRGNLMPILDIGQNGIGKIKKAFNDFLDHEEMAALGVPGVPTAAALHGVSHRFKRPYAKRARRPSFIDTGLYEASFVAWVD